jgi:general secretion pathway protein G
MADANWRQGVRALPARRSRRPGLAPPSPRLPRAAAGFSLIELVIVGTIIAIVAAIAVRRVGRHAEQGATSAARQDESVLQQAIERYRAEHGGDYPSAAGIADQLTKYTDVHGATSPTPTAPYVYGPYVRKIPPVPVGPAKGATKIDTAMTPEVGWVYDPANGTIRANEGP